MNRSVRGSSGPELAAAGRDQLTFKFLHFGIVRLPYENPDKMISGLKRCGIIRAQDTTLSVDCSSRIRRSASSVVVLRDTEPIPSRT